MHQVTIDQVLNCPALPSLPSVAVEVIALTGKRNMNLNEIAQVVQNDQALTAKILKTVNSSYYGLTKPCPTITRAISYLGLSTVKSLVLGFSLVDTTRAGDGINLEEHWRRAVFGAAAAKRIASQVGCGDPEEAFIAALMQDIGMTAINAAWPEGYARVLSAAGSVHADLPAAETSTLGFTHCRAGARLTERWRLPGEITAAIEHHHCPDAAMNHQAFVRCVALGALAAAALQVHAQVDDMTRLRSSAQKWFTLTDGQVGQLLAHIADDARDIARLFRVPTGEAPNIREILAQAEEASLRHQFDVHREAETLRQTNSDLARMALTDGLTGAGNRNFFDTELHRLFARSRASAAPLAVIMIDADKFKTLNDTHGHQVGDAVLMEIAWRMKSVASGRQGLVCRYGGEEFAILLPASDRAAAAQLADHVRRAVADSPVIVRTIQATPSIGVTVSVGVAVYEPSLASPLTSPELLVQAADKALYAAKAAGRNCVRIYTERGASAVAA